MTTHTSRPIGFVGLGAMGALMAARLAHAGHALVVHDIRSDVVAAFCAQHPSVQPAASLASMAQSCGIVITILPTSREVRDVVLGTAGDGLVAGAHRDLTIIDMTSGVPSETQAIAARVADAGATMVDAPVSGGIKGAREGTLAIMVGGGKDTVTSIRPVLEVLGKRVFHAGDVGAGQAVKALNNFVSAMGLIAAGEALTVGQRFGVSPEVLVDILNASTGRNNTTENKLKPFVLSGSYAGGFAYRLMRKDLAIARSLSEAMDAPGGLARHCSQLWDAAADDLPSDADHTEIIRWLGFDAKTAT